MENNNDKPFIILEELADGSRFYTSSEEETRLLSGIVSYRILGYANNGDEARQIIRNAK